MTTTSNLREILATINGTSFIGLDTVTTEVLPGGKGNPLQGRVKKHTTGITAMLFQNKFCNGYEQMVKRRLIAEGKDSEEYTLGPRAWGTRLEGLPIVEHKGKHYLEVIVQGHPSTHYTVDGEPVVKDKDGEGNPILQSTTGAFLTKLKPAQAGGEQGGLEDKVIIRTYGIENVTELRANKQVYHNLTYSDDTNNAV